jgi:hypothetical protein
MRIDHLGNVGIGTDSPDSVLHIKDDTSTVYDATVYQKDLLIERKNTSGNGQSAHLKFVVTGHEGSTTGEASIGAVQTANASSADLVFTTRNAGTRGERMRIDSSGNVGIGTANPATELDVDGDIIADGMTLDGTAGSRLILGRGNGQSSIKASGADANANYLALDSSGGGGALLLNNYVSDNVWLATGGGSVGIGATSPNAKLHVSTGTTGTIAILEGSSGRSLYTGTDGGGHYIESTGTQASQRVLRIQASDGGSNYTQLFIDGANENIYTDSGTNVGIGTSSPSAKLDVAGDAEFADTVTISDNVAGTFEALVLNNSRNAQDEIGNAAKLSFQHNSVNAGEIRSVTTEDFSTSANRSADLTFHTVHNGTLSQRLTINDDGNVGIGTANPAAKLDVNGATYLRNVIYGYAGGGNQYGGLSWDGTDEGFLFLKDSNVTKVIINSNGNSYLNGGNVLVGKTADDNSIAGTTISNIGIVKVTRSDFTLLLNRLSTDGEIAQFRKDGTTVGSIGTTGGDLYFADASYGGIKPLGDGYAIVPSTNSGADYDNAMSLGASSIRWKDLYLGGSVYLGGTGSANALDDYEEGTWTPAFSPQDDIIDTVTYDSVRFGRYTKIGDTVHVWGRIRTDVLTFVDYIGALNINGLPFTPATILSSGTSTFAGTIGYATAWGGDDPLFITAESGVDKIELWYKTSFSGNVSAVQTTDAGSGANSNDLIFQLTYKV